MFTCPYSVSPSQVKWVYMWSWHCLIMFILLSFYCSTCCVFVLAYLHYEYLLTEFLDPCLECVIYHRVELIKYCLCVHGEMRNVLSLICVRLWSNKIVLCLAESYEELYCFAYKPNTDEEGRQQEWGFLDLKAEYSRMGLPNPLWRLSSVNRHYKVREPTSLPSGTFFYPNMSRVLA